MFFFERGYRKVASFFFLVVFVVYTSILPLVSAFPLYASDTSGNSVETMCSSIEDVDRGTFKEYCFYIVQTFFDFKKHFETNGTIDETLAKKLQEYARKGYEYLPDTLKNKNYLNNLEIAIESGIKNPSSSSEYRRIITELNTYLTNVSIPKLQGSISVTPETGNAPFTPTFRATVVDPTGSTIPSGNYVWWMNISGKKYILGSGISLMHTFREEGIYTIFLDVRSAHKNSLGNTDVLPYSGRITVRVKQKLASVIIYVNGQALKDKDEIKFTPEEGMYGLIIDATNSTPTAGTQFVKTEWDFGNGIKKKYDGGPKVERVVYTKQDRYPVHLTITLNEGSVIHKSFYIVINKPIATIIASHESGYIGERFTFSAKPTLNIRNLVYEWNIIDITQDKIISQQKGDVITYTFPRKGTYNIQLKVKYPTGNGNSNVDTDTKIIVINSRAPVADFQVSIPSQSKPNRVFLDASATYDQDAVDMGNLEYVWKVDNQKISIEAIDEKGIMGYYTFDSIGKKTITLEVTDPDQMKGEKKKEIQINSLLDVDIEVSQKIVQRGTPITFTAIAPKAVLFEWNFGDGTVKTTEKKEIEYTYQVQGIYYVTLKVRDIQGNQNSYTTTVYVGESDKPYAMITVDYGNNVIPQFDSTECGGNGAYIVNRVNTVYFRATESVDIDGKKGGLYYTWKLGESDYIIDTQVVRKFTELGCYSLKLTVRSQKNQATDSKEVWVKVVNLPPRVQSLSITTQNVESDPVIVNVQAIGAEDPDGIIQSYLWYYYTDFDLTPQDIRMTTLPSTRFVIPKVAGTYYFVLVVKDNNEQKFSTKENLKDAKFFISLVGDNINTPIIDLKVNKNNINIGDTVYFQAEVKNVVGEDITKQSKYSWDFDGDGFYEQETEKNTIEYTYKKSGVFYPKVRAKHKGITNIRNIELHVSNFLEPDFEYIAVGKKYVFFNTTRGTYDRVIWKDETGEQLSDKNIFDIFFIDDSKEITLDVMEGGNTKTKAKTVKPDMEKLKEIKQGTGLIVLSYPSIQNRKITVKESTDPVYLHLAFSKGDVTFYGIDTDIETDSDLNGGKDDDIDNKNEESYRNGMIQVPLNKSKKQMVRIFGLDKNHKVILSDDIVLEKEYVKEEITLDSLTFTGITQEEQVKIEKLKHFIQSLPQQNRLQGMEYVKKLQESWFFPHEKTKVVLEFEDFIDSLKIPEGQEIIRLLESFLVESKEKTGVRDMAYNVLKNLIPKDIQEYETVMKNIDTIYASPEDIEKNRTLGVEILEIIKDTPKLTTDEKLNIKTYVGILVYGSIDSIPKEEKEEKVSSKDTKKEKNDGKGFWESVTNIIPGKTGNFSIVHYIIFLLLGFLLLAFSINFVWNRLKMKQKSLEGNQLDAQAKSPKQENTIQEKGAQPATNEKQVSKNMQDEFGDFPSQHQSAKESIIKENTQKNNTKDGGMQDALNLPDWLIPVEDMGKASQEQKPFEGTNKQEKKQEKQVQSQGNVIQENNEEKDSVVLPDWLKASFDGTQTSSQKTDKEIPDWLQELAKTNSEKEKGNEEEKKGAGNTQSSSNDEMEAIPSWLRGIQNQDATKSPNDTDFWSLDINKQK